MRVFPRHGKVRANLPERLLRLLLSFALLVSVLIPLDVSSTSAEAAQRAEDWAIPGGRFFTQTTGGNGGYSVVNDGQARFWAEFQRLGGLQYVGYPISRRFHYEGFVTQAFQKLILQWRPEVGQAWPVNVFDELSEKAFDEQLHDEYQTPPPLQNFDAPDDSWPEIVVNRQGLLNANPAIQRHYRSVPDPLTVFGLPVSRVEDNGNHYVIRTQRAVFQQWKERVPWAAAGQVTIANGGDIAKTLGWLPANAVPPEPVDGEEEGAENWRLGQIVVSPGASGRLYGTEVILPVPGQQSAQERLVFSDDWGTTWRPLPGGLPVEEDCMRSISADENNGEAFYAATGGTIDCEDGLYHYQKGTWTKRSSQELGSVTSVPGAPQTLWGTPPGGTGYVGPLPPVIRSDNGGESWRAADPNLHDYQSIVDLAPLTSQGEMAYAVIFEQRTAYLRPLYRARPGGEWQNIPLPEGVGSYGYMLGADAERETIYLSAFDEGTIWRLTNPYAHPAELNWEQVASFAGKVNLLDAGPGPDGTALYIKVMGDGVLPTVYRSLDSGETWEQISSER